MSLLVCYVVSKRERTNLVGAIQSAARTSVSATETLHGDKVFSVRLLPGESGGAVGYLLKLSAGSSPGTLLCRQVHFPQDWCWPRVLETTHVLRANREQYFFVTCDQGLENGDPRPFSCSVAMQGDARIESCRRVDMTDWDRLPASTVFCDGESSPGSPRSVASNSVMRWPNWPAMRSAVANDWRVEQRYAHDSLFVGPQQAAPRSRPIEHLVARNAADGNWQIAISDGRKFQPAPLTYQSPKSWLNQVSGDFTGDGMEDLLGRASDGSWWLGAANGNAVVFRKLTIDLPSAAIDYVGVGDFNGDGIDDLAIHLHDGTWCVGLSDGLRIRVRTWARWPASIPPENICIGDFDADGHADIAGLEPQSGQWIVSKSDGKQAKTSVLGRFSPNIDWRHVMAADFNGDGRCDVAAWNSATGEWMLGQSDGERFDVRTIGRWPIDADWQFVSTGRFADDGSRGLVALDKKSGRIAIAMLERGNGTAAKLTTRLLPGIPALGRGIFVGCFDGEPRDNLAAVAQSGDIWVGILDGDSIRYEKWGALSDAAHLADTRGDDEFLGDPNHANHGSRRTASRIRGADCAEPHHDCFFRS